MHPLLRTRSAAATTLVAILLALFPTSPAAGGELFLSNSTLIALPTDGGPASPYPSQITLDWCPGIISDVNLELSLLTHTNPDDVDILLVGPGGQNALVMSDSGGGTDSNNIQLTLDDEAPNSLPNESFLEHGAFRPANYPGADTDAFTAPAPAPSGGSALSVFDGSNPTGTWSLYARDDLFNDGGDIGAGWSLEITATGTGGGTHICIPTNGTPEPYPSSQSVAGLAGEIADVDLRLDGLTSGTPDLLAFQLVGPGGQNAMVMADAGHDVDAVDLTLTLDDEASLPLPDQTGLFEGSFRPADHGASSSLPPPAPPPSGTSALSVFDGTDPNGEWRLFGDASFIHSNLTAWELEITMTPPTITGKKDRAAEGKPLAFKISRSGPGMHQSLELPFRSKGKGAKPGRDFAKKRGTLTLGPGQTSARIKVRTKDDAVEEGKEKVLLVLNLPGGGTLKVVGVIKDDT